MQMQNWRNTCNWCWFQYRGAKKFGVPDSQMFLVEGEVEYLQQCWVEE